MEKERIFKTILLFGVLCTVFLISFYDDNQTTDDMDFQCLQRYQHSTSVYDPDYSNCRHYNETLELLPPDWLLKLYNISVNESFEP